MRRPGVARSAERRPGTGAQRRQGFRGIGGDGPYDLRVDNLIAETGENLISETGDLLIPE